MKNDVASERGANLIWNYAKKQYSWKESYYKHFTKGQKFAFFLPVLFLFFPIYGTYDLFYNHSWSLFITFGLLMLFSIWWFHKQKAYIESKIFSKYYLAKNCSTIIDYHKHKLVENLGELNTKENRYLWKSYFDGKMKDKRKIAGVAVIFAILFYTQFSAPYKQEYLSFYYMFGIGLLALTMTAVFIMPAFINFKFKTAIFYQAHSLVIELEKE